MSEEVTTIAGLVEIQQAINPELFAALEPLTKKQRVARIRHLATLGLLYQEHYARAASLNSDAAAYATSPTSPTPPLAAASPVIAAQPPKAPAPTEAGEAPGRQEAQSAAGESDSSPLQADAEDLASIVPSHQPRRASGATAAAAMLSPTSLRRV